MTENDDERCIAYGVINEVFEKVQLLNDFTMENEALSDRYESIYDELVINRYLSDKLRLVKDVET